MLTISTTSVLTTDNIGRCVPLYCSVFNEEPWNDDWTEDAAFERLLTFETDLIEKGYVGAYLETLGEGPSSDFYTALGFDNIPLIIL